MFKHHLVQSFKTDLCHSMNEQVNTEVVYEEFGT